MKLLFILLTMTSVIYLLPDPLSITKVEWNRTVCDFGEILYGKPVSTTFEATNLGSEPFVIKRVQGSCGCTATEFSKEPIPPGGKGSILATFNAKSTGSFNKTISVYTDVQQEPYILTVKGKVMSEIN